VSLNVPTTDINRKFSTGFRAFTNLIKIIIFENKYFQAVFQGKIKRKTKE